MSFVFTAVVFAFIGMALMSFVIKDERTEYFQRGYDAGHTAGSVRGYAQCLRDNAEE